MKRVVFFLFGPLFLAVNPVIALYAYNMHMVEFVSVYRILLAALVMGMVVYLVIGRLSRDKYYTTIISSLFIFMFFSYGHFVNVLSRLQLDIPKFRWHYLYNLLLMPLWVVLFFQLVKVISCLSQDQKKKVIAVLNRVVIVFFILSVSNITFFNLQAVRSSNAVDDGTDIIWLDNTAKPDIYYLIFDAYARGDILQSVFGYDNGDFLKNLTAKGFYVAPESSSNYSQTYLSLASSLNMEYINFLQDEQGADSADRRVLRDLIADSRISQILKNNGYTVVTFPSVSEFVSMDNANIKMPAPSLLFNEFETNLLRTTFYTFIEEALLYNSDDFFAAIGREKIIYPLEHMEAIAKMDEPTFTFAHILSPHPPFFFDENGARFDPYLCGADGDHYSGGRDVYLERYPEQVAYLSNKIQEAVEDILNSSDRDPVIILQADHGSGAYLVWEDITKTNVRERMSIFNAYYLPGGVTYSLYDTITPVNSFRVVLNRIFAQEYELLEDRSYFSEWKTPYRFIDVTEQLVQW